MNALQILYKKIGLTYMIYSDPHTTIQELYTMIFTNQLDVNTFLESGGDEKLLTLPSVLAPGVEAKNTGVVRKIEFERLTYLNRSLLIDEFGNISDGNTFEKIVPSKVKINNVFEVCLPFKNAKNQRVYKRAIHLVALAFLKGNTPRKIARHNNDIRLLMVNNIKKWNKSFSREVIAGERNIMPFLDQETFNAFLAVNNLKEKSEITSFFAVEDKDYGLINPNRLEISSNAGYKPDKSILSSPIYYYGSILRLDMAGGLYKESEIGTKTVLSRVMSRYSAQGVVMSRVSCADGKTRHVTIANLMAKTFLGLDFKERRKIKYIDGNPTNLHASNLWWKGCEKQFGFS